MLITHPEVPRMAWNPPKNMAAACGGHAALLMKPTHVACLNICMD